MGTGGIWRRRWERLKAGESFGKLPLRTCLERSVPEPYRSLDWALVPAKLAQGLNTTTNNNSTPGYTKWPSHLCFYTEIAQSV
jgi:hypothetical protein